MQFRKETGLKILIGLGSLAIAVSAYTRWGQTYIAELSSSHLDAQRVNDLGSLSGHLTGTAPIGKKNTIYISLPSAQENCSDLALPSLPNDWAYHCAPSSNFTKTDGTGWLPLNFGTSISTLPIDPVNKVGSLEYYSFVVNNIYTGTRFNKATWALTAAMTSNEYLKEKAQTDGGADPFRYEISTDPKNWADAQGIIGGWLPQAQTMQSFLVIDPSKDLNELGKSIKEFSIVSCFRTSTAQDQSILEKWVGMTYPFALRGPLPQIRFSAYDGINNPTAIANGNFNDDKLHCAVGLRSLKNKSISLYVDGKRMAVVGDSTIGPTFNSGSLFIGGRNLVTPKTFSGDLRGVMIYKRLLNMTEISKLRL